MKITTTHTELQVLIISFLAMSAVILSALAFEHIGGYVPCKLCLEQRLPWYAGIALTGAAILIKATGRADWAAKPAIIIAGLIMLVSLALGIRHAGVEWGWWMGPSDCGVVEGGLANTTEGFLAQLDQTVPPSCNEAALRVLGLSFAGWNALASLGLLLLIAYHLLSERRR